MADILKAFEKMDELYKLQDKQRETMNELRAALMLKHTFPDLEHPVTLSLAPTSHLEAPFSPRWTKLAVRLKAANRDVEIPLLHLPFILWPRRVQDAYNSVPAKWRPKNVDMTGVPK